jgi:hypothetical protein
LINILVQLFIFIFCHLSRYIFSFLGLLSLIIALLNSTTVLLLTCIYPVNSPPVILLLVIYLQTSLPLPSPVGLFLSISLLVVHITMVFTFRLREVAPYRIELVRQVIIGYLCLHVDWADNDD